MNSRFLAAGLAAIVAVAVLVVAGVVGVRAVTGDDARRARTSVDDDGTYEYDFAIPRGTAAAIRAGEDVEIVPRELRVHVGESIRLTNNDSEDHLVGVFFVAAGETSAQRFTSEGMLEGACSIHPTGRFTVRVDA